MADNTWSVVKTDPSEAAIESANSVFTISNGYFGIKGNLLENRVGRYPTTLLAGVFDQADMLAHIRPSGQERRYLNAAKFDEPELSAAVANLPDPLFVRAFIDGRELSFRRGKVTNFQQTWNFRSGVYAYEFEFEGEDGRKTHIHMSRMASMQDIHRAYMFYAITPANWSGRVEIRSGIDGTIRSNLDSDPQWEIVKMDGDPGRCRMDVRTIARGHDVSVAVANTFHGPKQPLNELFVEDGAVYNRFEVLAREGQTIGLEKAIVLASSEDERYGVACDVDAEVAEAGKTAFAHAVQANQTWWSEMWRRVDVKIGGDDKAQGYMRFCMFQLMAAAPRHTDKLSVPCKFLTGDYYQGCVFYDTDLYTEPVYLFNVPEVARGCLNYRYNGLPAGRKIAERLGYKGSKFAWQSGPYGEEVLGPWWRFTHTNIHINGDVAYSLMQYWRATGDDAFLENQGADILVESARFYASRAVQDAGGAWHLRDVSGPDEGHCESTDNYYTNDLARHTLAWAAGLLDRLQGGKPAVHKAVVKRLGVQPEEPGRWREVAEGLQFLLNPKTNVFEQYDGFYDLLPIPPNFKEGQKEYWFTVFPYQAIHQPDVVMAQTMFREEVPADVYRANYEFYRERGMNFSSMSYVINSIAAAQVGDLKEAYEQFLITAGEDLDETLTGRGDVKDGLHGTATGGAWMAVAFGFGGIHLTESELWVDPGLPEHWTALAFGITLRGERLWFDIDRNTVEIKVEDTAGVEIPARVCGESVTLKSGESYSYPLNR